MKYLITACLLFVAFATSGQKATNINTTVDEFTGEKMISTELIEFKSMVSYGGGLMFSLHHMNGSNYLAAIVSTSGLTTMDEYQRMIIKLVDGSLINLSCLEYAISEYKSGSTYHLAPVFGLTDDDLTKLSTLQIERIRFETSDGNIDMEPSKKAPAICMDSFAEFQAVVK